MNEGLKNMTAMEQQKLLEAMDVMEPKLTVKEIQEMLEYTQKGAVKNNRHNCNIILEHDPLLMIFKEALDNTYVKSKKSDTDRICEIMNTSIVGWIPRPTTRFAD